LNGKLLRFSASFGVLEEGLPRRESVLFVTNIPTLLFVIAPIVLIAMAVTESVIPLIIALILVLIDGVVLGPRRRRRIFQVAAECVEEHLTTLARKRAQTLTCDEYGNLLTDKWLKEIEYFVQSVIARKLSLSEIKILNEKAGDLVQIIDRRVGEEHQRREEKAEFEADMTPYEFEQFCASRLSGAGWNARATQATGDQGADVVAEKNGKVAVFQCKMYSQPVGNKAVQEIVAAKSFHHADYAAVVSNADYTRSARALAQANGVLLLHYHDLDDLGFA
jgi:restriction system protein